MGVYANQIVDYSISDWMTAHLAVDALNSVVVRRRVEDLWSRFFEMAWRIGHCRTARRQASALWALPSSGGGERRAGVVMPG